MPTPKEIVEFMASLHDDLVQVLDAYVDAIPDDAPEYAVAIMGVLARLAATLASKCELTEDAFAVGMAATFRNVRAEVEADNAIAKAMGGADTE
jgi:hypothetical protein